MLLKVHPQNPQSRLIEKVLQVYRAGGVVVLPTDTTYGLTCDLYSKSATRRLYQFRHLSTQKLLSILCVDLKQVSEYAIITTPVYRQLRRVLPGPYTSILEATGALPNYFERRNRRQVGVRIPAYPICQAMLEGLAHPLLITSLLPEDSASPVSIDPSVLYEREKHYVDCVVDVGILPMAQSTIVDFTLMPPQIVRKGKGDDTLFRAG